MFTIGLGFSGETEPVGDIYIYIYLTNIYGDLLWELAHNMVMEAKKSHNLPSVSQSKQGTRGPLV